MESSIWKINKAGLYGIGHFNVMGVKLLLGDPNTRLQVDLTNKKTAQLLNALDIDWEDGGFIEDLLVGQTVKVDFGDDERAVSIGDPFGHKTIKLHDDEQK